MPANPGAWLTTVARNRALDRLRQRATHTRKLEDMAETPRDAEPAPDSPIEDERLRLMSTCCHPALPLDARVALTLRALGVLTTVEIARAFLVSELRGAAGGGACLSASFGLLTLKRRTTSTQMDSTLTGRERRA